MGATVVHAIPRCHVHTAYLSSVRKAAAVVTQAGQRPLRCCRHGTCGGDLTTVQNAGRGKRIPDGNEGECTGVSCVTNIRYITTTMYVTRNVLCRAIEYIISTYAPCGSGSVCEITCTEGGTVSRTLYRHMPRAAVYVGLHVSRGYEEHCINICRVCGICVYHLDVGGSNNIVSTYATRGNVCKMTCMHFFEPNRGSSIQSTIMYATGNIICWGTENIISTYAHCVRVCG